MVQRGSAKVSVDTKNLTKRLNRILSRIDKEARLSVDEVARFGRDQIQLYMPKDTGESASSIGYTVTVNAKGVKIATIMQIDYPHHNKTMSKLDPEWFNIPLWMFTSDKAIAHYKRSNGSIIAMRGVIDTMRREFGVDVKRRFKDPTIFK